MESIPVQVKADVIKNWLYKHKKREAEENKNGINLALVYNITVKSFVQSPFVESPHEIGKISFEYKIRWKFKQNFYLNNY